jgi:hypothetical protein
MLEKLIMVEEFLRQDAIAKDDVRRFKRWFPIFLDFFKNVVDRQMSTALKLLKFHLCTHFADDIIKWGLPSSYNSSTGESNHKMLKRRARKTQRQQNLIEEQTGVRYVEQIAIRKTLSDSSMNGHYRVIRENMNSEENTQNNVKSGFTYQVFNNGIFKHIKKNDYDIANWYDRQLSNEIFMLLRNRILPHLDAESMQLFTFYKSDGVIYRGDPSYKGVSWQDWALCDWGPDGLIPIHILIYVDLSSLKVELDINGVIMAPGGQYAVVHMIEKPLEDEYFDEDGNSQNYKAHPKSELFYKATKIIDGATQRPALTLIPIESIAHGLVAVKSGINGLEEEHTYIFL